MYRCSDVLRKKQLLHTTYKLYLGSVALQVLGLFILCLAYGLYASDGRDNYGLKTFG